MNFNPISRSPLHKHPREHKDSAPWRRKKVRLNGSEMKELRQNAFYRASGQCENAPFGDAQKSRCPVRIYWTNFHLAHIESRGRGGSDTLENVLACCPDCHFEDTRNRRKLVPHGDWIGAV